MADKIYNYAMTHGKAMRGHTLVWHNHQPQALDDYIQDYYDGNMEDDKSKNPEEFKRKRKKLTKSFLAEYMKTVGERYPNCYCWDVINEIVPDVHTQKPSEQEKIDGLRHSKWFEYLGKDFYIDVLETARDNLPKGTKLFYNEYGEQNEEKRKAIIQVIENIKKYEQENGKVLLDGIGLQSHYDLNITEQQIEDIYKDFSATGKEIQVTEMDVTPGMDENRHHLEYNPQNMPQYAKIWNKVFSSAEQLRSKIIYRLGN
jgi:endo-1,4-beta-xylanase